MDRGPLQVTGKVVGSTTAGEFLQVVFAVEEIPRRARPGQVVMLPDGFTRRAFWVRGSSHAGPYGDSLEIVVGPRSRPYADAHLSPGTVVDVVGPVGRPFALPKDPMTCVLVGGGYATGALLGLLSALREQGSRSHVVLGAPSANDLYGVLEAQRTAHTVQVATSDGSMGTRGEVVDVLGDVLERTGSPAVYAAGPTDVLREVAHAVEAAGAWSQCALEVPTFCGTGMCGGCVLPVRGEDALVRMVRGCTEGPVLRGDRVLWDDLGTVPDGTLGTR